MSLQDKMAGLFFLGNYSTFDVNYSTFDVLK